MLRSCAALILVANSARASRSGAAPAYDFARYEYDRHRPYDAHRTNPVIEKYFSRHRRGDLRECGAIARVLSDPQQLADLKATVGRILCDLQNTLGTVTEQVKKVAQGSFKSRWIRYPAASPNPFGAFLDRNVGSLPWPPQFISRYIEFFLTKYITKQISTYGDRHSITDGLFERLALLSELDSMFAVCTEHGWSVPVDQVLAAINETILDSYRHLHAMLEAVASSPTLRESRRDMWIKRAHAYKYFIGRRIMSVDRIASRIRDVQSGASRERPQGVIQSDRIYDITSPSNQTEDVDLPRLQDAIRRLNDIRFNNSECTNAGGVAFLADSGHRRLKNFKYSVGPSEYFLKSLDSTPDYVDYCNSNDILFEGLDSPYIAKIHRVLYNHVALEGRPPSESWWTLSEFLPVSVESLDRTDMGIIRRLSGDVLNALGHLQSVRVVHNDLHLGNIRGEQVQADGKTEYRFKIVDFGASYHFSLADDTPAEKHREEDLLRVFGLIRSFASPAKREAPAFDDFISGCMSKSHDVEAKIRRLLLHPFITGGRFDRRRRTQHQPPMGWHG